MTSPAKRYGKRIDALLDAALGELQHDTGESDHEWHFQRQILAEKFAKILRCKLPAAPGDAV